LVGPVVVELVVVPHHDPGRHGVRVLQVRVGLVLGVPLPVVGQRPRFRAGVVAGVAAGGHVVPGLVLVVVVAEVQHQVRVLLGEVPVGGEVAVLVLGAGGERHGQRHHRGGGRGGAGAADRGEGAGGPEPVEVL